MRFALLLPAIGVLVGCTRGDSFDRSIADTQKQMTTRVRELDTTKPPPPLPVPENPPKQIDIEKVKSESAKVTSLRIVDVEKGSGAAVEPGKYLSVHYVGVLPDGYLFDTSYKGSPAQPYTFRYDPSNPGVIQGWIQGLVGMRVGGHRRLTIPAALGYGDNPPPGSPIPAGAVLIFDIQLMFVGDTE